MKTFTTTLICNWFVVLKGSSSLQIGQQNRRRFSIALTCKTGSSHSGIWFWVCIRCQEEFRGERGCDKILIARDESSRTALNTRSSGSRPSFKETLIQKDVLRQTAII